MTRFLSFVLAAAAPAIVAATIVHGSTPDEEEFRFAILASTLQVRSLADGVWPWWTSALGLGIPQPLVPNFNMHPLLPLLAVVSPVMWVRLLYVTHTVAGAVGMWRLARALTLGPVSSGVCVFSFLLATPTQNYVLTDFWPTHYVVWTSAPWLLLLAWRFLAATEGDLRRRALQLGIVAGLVLANTNPGHVVVYGTVALAIAVARWRDVVRRWPWAILAVALTVAISAPNHVQLAVERTMFNDELGIQKAQDSLPASAAWDLFLRPIGRPGGPPYYAVGPEGTRTLFFGGPFALLALAGLWVGRAHRDLLLGVALTAPLLFASWPPITFASRFHFRDPLTLCAILLAGAALDALWRSRRGRPLGVLLVVVQIASVGAAIDPYLAAAWESREARWFRGATGETGMVDALIALMPEPGRLAYSPQVDTEVALRARLSDGLGVNALAFRGVALVNGLFKGVSTDALWPDDRLFYGRVLLPAPLIESDGGLDVLGIRYALANPGEPVAAGLIERGTVAKRDGTRLVLYENRDVWPGAFVIRGETRDLGRLPVYPGCGNDRLLCRDLGVLARRGQPQGIRIARHGGDIDVTLDADTEPRLLVVAEMFRPAWTASAGGAPLATMSIGPGLLGVHLPPTATSVRLEYTPTLLAATTTIAWSVLTAGLLTLLVSHLPARDRRR